MWKLYLNKINTLKSESFQKKINLFFFNSFSNLYNNHSTNVTFFINNNQKLLTKVLKTSKVSALPLTRYFILVSMILVAADILMFTCLTK